MQVSRSIITITFLWLLISGLGFWYLIDYHQRPCSCHPSQDGPKISELKLAKSSPTFILAVHPQCACTRASSRELNRILSRCSKSTKVYALIYVPKDRIDQSEWLESATMDELALIPGVEQLTDVDGRYAKDLGMSTSGDLRIYQSDGSLLFYGGLTIARGHEGDSLASQKIGALLSGELKETQSHPVYGCSLGNCNCQESVDGRERLSDE